LISGEKEVLSLLCVVNPDEAAVDSSNKNKKYFMVPFFA
jgi:hypothetical protein